MIIKVREPNALRLAFAALDKKPFKPFESHVRFEPSGAITGTEGHKLAYHPAGLEPYQGQTLYLHNLSRALPTKAVDIALDTDRALLTYRVGKAHKNQDVKVSPTDIPYPDPMNAIPRRGVEQVRTFVGFNADYAHDLVNALDDLNHGHIWQLATGNTWRLVTADPEQVVILSLLKDTPAPNLPLPVGA